MADARLRMVTARIEAGAADDIAVFRASGKTIEFPGFFRAYVEGSDDPEAALEDQDQPLPDLKEGDQPECTKIEAEGHETKPPARYTEASLIKKLEDEGIGRPSTYATIIDTIIGRGYVNRKSNQLIPTFTAFATNAVLEQQFDQLVNVGFTAGMEEELDNIAAGSLKSGPYLKKFYQGQNGLETLVEGGLDRIDARSVSTITSPKWGEYIVRVGRYGPYAEREVQGERLTASLPADIAPGDLTLEMLESIVAQGNEEDRVLGIDPVANEPILMRNGPYGVYLQLGEEEKNGKPKRISIPKNIAPEEVDLDTASALLALPRQLGVHPESGQPILTHIGRYGPYVQHGRTYASLTPEDDVLSVELPRALELLQKKEGKTQALKVLGNHPESGEPIEVLEGRYGPYVKHQKVNASLPKGTSPDTLTMEAALELLAKKAGAKKTKGGGRRKKKE
ncbi:MAG: topoisomerase C-terminal repeat-containing protein [Rhodothermales bacterium]